HNDVRTTTDRGYNTGALQAAIDADPSIATNGSAFSTSTLGSLQRQHSVAITDSGSASIVAMGKLATLPAGPLRTTLRIGGAYSALSS
ncbi:hypothetical protein C1X73_36645, partial [Pseudomonas sp. FW305-130]